MNLAEISEFNIIQCSETICKISCRNSISIIGIDFGLVPLIGTRSVHINVVYAFVFCPAKLSQNGDLTPSQEQREGKIIILM